ncbi:MAG: class I SAM-dependent methyltransferase [Sedimentisphaerales bacterium]|jgi:SAM-dependent methyltransferase
MKFPDRLKLPETRNIKNIDDPAVTMLHRDILRKKEFLRKLYTDVYRQFRHAVPQTEGKTLVELGSGGGFIKEVIPNVVTSDILRVAGVDKVFSATDMPFEDSSVDAFFMFDVLHHIAGPKRFFSEAIRCLRPGGRVIMIEPANTPWARFIYKNFHHEGFDPKGGWEIIKAGPLSQANGALPWIIFVRDRETFEREYPQLKIVSLCNHTPILYLLSGGFTLRQLVPGGLYPVAKAVEYLLSPASNLLGMFMTVVLEKSDGDKSVAK